VRLNNAEKLFITRKRMEHTQQGMAEHCGITRLEYIEIEKGEKPLSYWPYDVLHLQPNEKCVIARRRFGITQQELADQLSFSRYYINKMENGHADCGWLTGYWFE